MPFPRDIPARARHALADVAYTPFWLDDARRPDASPAFVGAGRADLVVVGGGFSGLWTALRAVERYPGIDVVLLEGTRIAEAATGRNGGFVAASITHGLANGAARWPNDLAALARMGRENLEGIDRTVREEGIDCDFQRSGEIDIAIDEYQIEDLRHHAELAASVGLDYTVLDTDQVRARVNSPTYLAGGFDPTGVAMVNPARLAWGLAEAARRRGVRVYENSRVEGLERNDSGVMVRTEHGRLQADRVALATSAFPPLLKRLGWYVIPVYDSVLVTEPLTPDQLAAIGWEGREGLADSGNQFHYYRITEDNRILWGGFDASYYGDFGAHRERNPESFARLSAHFAWTFPQLADVRFSHAWAGAIDTCSRFSAFWGTAHDGRVAYSVGFTGLGVGASRFGADVMLDLLNEEETERTEIEMVRTKPLPFPPRPVRDIGIGITRWSLDRADHRDGQRNLWLKTLDRVGLGFDS